MKRILTGIQPSGAITLGNYIGAIKQIVNYQNDYETIIFIADMHAITVSQDPKELPKNIKNLLALYLASGVDFEKNTIFLQSENVYHANVSWMLECLTPYGELSRMTQFKDKSSKNASFSAGLLTYPVLMASDILIYDADLVPTGQDQKQHVELARNIAERVNKKYNTEIFKLPEPLISKDGAKIMDLQDPSKKMSKSSENQKGVIYLLEDLDVTRKKIMASVTDSVGKINYDLENQAGISNLITLYSVFSGLTIEEVVNKFADSNYGTFKKEVADIIIENIKPIQEKYNELINSSKLDEILEKGKIKTNEIAKKKFEDLKNIIGLHR